MVLLAPSRVHFTVPPIEPNSVLTFTAGMPFASASDGMDLRIAFESTGQQWPLFSERINPSQGRHWTTRPVALDELARKAGDIVFSADVGESGNSDADWVAISRARICESANAKAAVYEFEQHLPQARIESARDVQYGTKGNLAVFPMTVSLEQQP